MSIKLKYRQAPLPFQGQKRKFVQPGGVFASEIAKLPDNTVFIDLFGGSGLLSRTVKDIKPVCRVIYNDYDDYHVRIENIPATNELLREIRVELAGIPNKKKLPQDKKATVLAILDRHEKRGFVDYITISASLLFSMKYVLNIDEMKKSTLYNNVKQSDYLLADDYLDGLEVRKCDYKELYKEFKDNPHAFFICDPPHLNTDVKTYKSYWNLRDYLDVLNCLCASRFVYFTSNKSVIVELLEWFEENYGYKTPFTGAQEVEVNTTVNNQGRYTDTMLLKAS